MDGSNAAKTGIGDAADARWAIVRQQLREAMVDKGYTYEDLAYLARISLRSVYSLFSGEQMSRIDTVMRVALVLGARIELDFSENAKAAAGGDDAPLPTTEPRRGVRSSGSRRSTTSRASATRRAAGDIAQRGDRKVSKRSSDQQRKPSAGGGDNCEYYALVIDLRKHRRVSPEGCLRRSA